MSAIDTITDFCKETDIGYEVVESCVIMQVPGTHRLRTTIVLTVGQRYVRIEAFVARNPDENHEAVYRWMLEQNAKLAHVAFCTDSYGDIYLSGALPLDAVTDELVDSVVGIVAAASDESFNALLALGFRSAIEREWAWRNSRGLPTDNLAAFEHLLKDDAQA